ncbi:MAG: hypothetical protein KatS3mg065_1192 [Chloroflexota bacterium]|nr:MAG: hypothetical protein KatS3mg065_1192 [Chloroflexota bacterium]
MEARIVPIDDVLGRSPEPRPEPRIVVAGDRLVVERLEVVDPAAAAVVAARPEPDRPALVERALRVGLLAIADATVTVDVDVVRREFDELLRRTVEANERATTALETILRQNFADGEGRLPRTLEAFLGDRGALRQFVTELFDETKRDSALGRLSTLLGSYFDGDASKLARLLDPTRLGSPLHQFRAEITAEFGRLHEKLAALEAAAAARAAERAKSAAKGTDFEDLLEGLLGELARGAGDLLERTSTEAGDVLRSKKGDFVLTLNPDLTRGAEVRVVIEAKNRAVSGPRIRDELREAKTNRGAAVGVVVFTPEHAPSGIAPFDIRAGDVYCVLDPEAPERATLEAAIRLARLLALASADERDTEIDAGAVAEALEGIRRELEAIRNLKTQLTSIGNATKAVWSGLDGLRAGILEHVAEAERRLRGQV